MLDRYKERFENAREFMGVIVIRPVKSTEKKVLGLGLSKAH